MKKTILEQTKKVNFKFLLFIACMFLLQGNFKSICNLNASFNYTVGANGVVNFASTSTGTTIAANYQWYFYPGSALGQSVTHTFNSNGTYPVTLYVNDSLCFDSTTVYVTVNTSTCNLNSNFSYTVNVNGVVNFASTSTGTTATTSYQWYFYPGSATGTSASHIYANAGTYPVSLVTINGNCYDSTLIYITVNTASCNLNANFSYTLGANGVVNFASTSTGTNVSSNYQWYFSPGSANGANVTHTYNNNGTYGVSLFVSDSSCYDSLTVYITVTTATCNLSAGFTYTMGANGVVNFASTSTGTNSGTTYQWYFSPGFGSGTNVTHTFASNGTYPVMLWVNNGSCSDSVVGYISINTTTCNLNANFNYTVNTNGSVNFASTSTGTTPFTNYYWFFNPGSAIGQTTTHNYTNNGTYAVTLYLSDSLCNDSITKYITIGNTNCNLNANFNYTVNANGSVHFASISTGTTIATSYNWYFYPGSAVGQIVNHTYTSNGTYPVTLYLSDSLCTDSITKYITISNISCNLHASFTYTVGANGVVHFASTSTNTTIAASFWWNFGDSQSGNGASVTHTYAPLGQYMVTLNVYDSLCHDSTAIMINTSVVSGIKNNNSNVASVKVYPNPNNGEFMLNIVDGETTSKGIELLIYNTLGQIVYKNDEEFVNGTLNKKIDLQAIPNGVYFLKMDNGTNSKTLRLVIQK
ncbi:MAG: PKD domain-containing protein [Bacteroidia bacterium]